MAQISKNCSCTYGILKSFFLLFSLNGIIGQSFPGKPGRPTGLILREATAYSLKLSWESEGTETLFQYKPKAEEQWMNFLIEGSTFTVRQLRPDTAYEFRVVAVNEYGQSQPSDVIEVRTGKLVPNKPTKVIAEPINSTAIFVEWQPPNNNGIILGYYVYYYETNNKDEMVGQELVQIMQDGNRNEAVITNLKADTQYSVEVAGYTLSGIGKRSKKSTVNTKELVPTPPRGLNVVLLDEDLFQVQVTWNIPKEVNGNLMGYQVIWGRKGEAYQMQELPPGTQRFISDVLDKGATYEFRVKAKNEIGLGRRAKAVMIIPNGSTEQSCTSKCDVQYLITICN